MNEISTEELSQVSAQAGITYVIGDSQLRVTADSIRISDTDHNPKNWIEFNNITVDDGEGGYFSMDTPIDDLVTLISNPSFNTIDIATAESGRTYLTLKSSTDYHPRTYNIGNFVFCNQDLGSIRLADMRRGASDTLIISGRPNGESGIDMEYNTELTMSSLKYSYNTQENGSLDLQGIHLTQYASGSPEDPTSWAFAGKFKIGDIANNNPMTTDVGTWTDAQGNTGTSVFMNVPMSGSVRVENVKFEGNTFGPIAIDGMKVHRLGIMLPGN